MAIQKLRPPTDVDFSTPCLPVRTKPQTEISCDRRQLPVHTKLASRFLGHALYHYVFYLTSRLIHPNVHFALVELHIEQKVVHVSYGV